MRTVSRITPSLALLWLVAGCSSSTIQTVNTPPAAAITLPPDDTPPTVEGDAIEFAGTAVDQGGNSDELQVSWISNHDGVFNTDPPDVEGIMTFTHNELSQNSHVITLTIMDPGGLTDEDQVTIVVLAPSDADQDLDGYTPTQGDCDDTNPNIFPGAEEDPNGVDDDCDGDIDEGTYLYDDDGDGYSEQDGDCDDDDEDTYPGASELPDEADNDCDGTIDEETVLYDDDGDGFTEADGDCDDTDPGVFPTATESPDGVDNNCDTLIDEDTPAYDDDGDGYCEGYDLDGDGIDDCSDGTLPGDCDDADAAINPLAVEACDGADNNCDGSADEQDSVGCTTYYEDLDGDNYGTTGACLCGPTTDYSAAYAGDCYDYSTDVHPGQTNWFTDPRGDNSFDYDCDGVEEQQYPDHADYDCDCDWLVWCTCNLYTQSWASSTPACGDDGNWVQTS